MLMYTETWFRLDMCDGAVVIDDLPTLRVRPTALALELFLADDTRVHLKSKTIAHIII